jgi:hypothetical protein
MNIPKNTENPVIERLWKDLKSKICKIRIAWKSSESILKEYSNHKLWKYFLQFKNIILEVKLLKKFKNGPEKFLASTIFEFCGQFFFQNEVLKLQKVFSELVKLFLRTDLESSRHFLFWDKPEVLKKISKTN